MNLSLPLHLPFPFPMCCHIDYATVHIDVLPVNDEKPEFTQTIYQKWIYEETPAEQLPLFLLQVTA